MTEKKDKSLKSKAIKIKGKSYVQVSDRVVYFNEEYPTGYIQTQYTEEDNRVTFKAKVVPAMEFPDRFFTGYSQAIWGDGMVNKTSALENAETSAVGRALAFMGIGVIEGIASVDEVNKAVNTDKAMEDLGRCDQCHSPKVMSKKGTAYCGAKCWLDKNPKKDYDANELEFIKQIDSTPVIQQEV